MCRGIPTKRYPLNGIFEFDQARALVEAGNEVDYLAIDMRSIRRTRKWGISVFYREGVRVAEYNFPIGVAPLSIHEVVGTRMALRLYKMLYQNNEPDIIHAHFTNYGEIASNIAKKYRKPLVITEHSSRMNNTDIELPLLKQAIHAYSGADSIIAVSTALAKQIRYHTGFESIVIPNMIGVDAFYLCQKKPHEGVGFITTCSLERHKRPEELLEAFISVAEENSNIFLGVVGEGSLKTKLQTIAERSIVKDRIKFYGLCNRNEIAEIYSGYDCFVLPSYRETYGVSFIEALAAGLPVIATRCGGPEDFINDNNGLLISVDNKYELQDALKKMVLTHGQYDSHRIKNDIRNQVSGEKVVQKIQEVYESCLYADCKK